MGNHSKGKGKEKASKRPSDSTKKVQKLLEQVTQKQAEYERYYNEYVQHTERAMVLQEQLREQRSQVGQLSDSGDVSQRARLGGSQMTLEQELYRRQTRRDDFRRSIEDLQNSINHFQSKAERASRKCSEKQKEISDLQAKLQYLTANPACDADNWFISGSDGHADFDEDGASGSVSWAGGGQAY